ncbi:MAG: DUF456 domain-containing protein [Burkholderiaceae bacterium]
MIETVTNALAAVPYTTISLWVLSILLIIVGAVGVVMPALPGTVFVFAGIALAAWIDSFELISKTTVAIVGVLAILAWITDYLSGLVGAKRVGASREAIIGGLIGTVAGIFFGFIGLVFFPLIGAAIGEYLAISDLRRAGNVGLATWLGMLVGVVLKLALTFLSIGIFIVALVF